MDLQQFICFDLTRCSTLWLACILSSGLQSFPFQLPRVIILIESYDELSAAADRGVGELRLMTLGNQGSS